MDAPTRELLKKDVAALDVPNDARLTLDGSRKASKAGETADWKPGDAFYKVGPLTAKEAPPTVFIGGHAPKAGSARGAYPGEALPRGPRPGRDPGQSKSISCPAGVSETP